MTIRERLKSLEGKMIEIYDKNDDFDNFNVGIPLALNEDYLLYMSINKDCYADGLRLYCNIDDISAISESSLYMDRIKFVSKLLGESLSTEEYAELAKDFCGINDILQYSMEYEKAVSFSLCGSGGYDVTGVVKDFNETAVTLLEISRYGLAIRTNIIEIQNIDLISCDSRDERIIAALYKHKDWMNKEL